MPLLHIAVLAIVQGLTEFLPISSSGHLILAWQALEQGTGQPIPPESQQLVMDIAVHVGTLFAVMVYFWRDLMRVAVGRTAMMRRAAQRVTKTAGYPADRGFPLSQPSHSAHFPL